MSSLTFVIFLILKFTLSDINIATPAYFLLVFAQYIFPYSFIFLTCLYIKNKLSNLTIMFSFTSFNITFIITFSFGPFRATPAAYGGSQARGQIGARAAGVLQLYNLPLDV